MLSSVRLGGMGGKKTRADNFSEEDKMLLLSLIADYVGILESRKTDHKSNSDKYKAWATISKRFHRMASHPRNFTQMKDLYRRLKLKAKKEVGIWLKACVDSGTGTPSPGSNVIRPDDTSFLVYEMIKPYKEELNPDDKEHERLLAEARKNRETNEFTVSIDLDEEIEIDEQAEKCNEENENEIGNSDEGDNEPIPIKEELDFDYVPPAVVESTPEASGENTSTPLRPRSERVLAKRVASDNHSESASSSIFNRSGGRRQKNSNRPWNSAKRMRTFPGVDMERHEMPRRGRFSSAFASRRDTWGDFGNGGTFIREAPAERHADVDDSVLDGMSPYESSMFQIAQTEHKAKMLVLQTKRRAETAKEEAYKMMWQNAQLQRDLLQLHSSNSPYNAGQDLNASGSFSSSQQESATNNNRPVPSTENNYRLLERKLEREREKRTHGEAPPQPSRLDSKGLTLRRLGLHVPPATYMHSSHLNPIQTLQLSTVLPEETSPSAMDIRRNGFRLTGKSTNATRTAADHSTTSSGSYRTASNKDVLSSMGTLTVASTPSSAALRGQSIGFGNRDLSTRSPTQRSKTRGGMVLPPTVNDKNKSGRYPYADPVHSASPSFQQRLSELAALESDTIRYERTKKIKKRSKQENQ